MLLLMHCCIALYLCGHDVGNVLLRELLEDSRLARVVQTQHQDTSLLVTSLQLTQQRQETHRINQSAVQREKALYPPPLKSKRGRTPVVEVEGGAVLVISLFGLLCRRG